VEEVMKFLLFTRENNIFDDILKDASLKNQYKTKIEYKENLILGFPEDDNFGKILSYIMLKYGDDMKDFHSIVPDRTPVPNVDYVPVRRDRN
jgi:predicted nucleotide-binding protein (sugar kinase/HSP70/actin superfamily)